MAFTSDLSGASSDSSHSIQLQYNGAVKTMDLYDRPGNDYTLNKGNLWELSLSSGCIKFSEIQWYLSLKMEMMDGTSNVL